MIIRIIILSDINDYIQILQRQTGFCQALSRSKADAVQLVATNRALTICALGGVNTRGDCQGAYLTRSRFFDLFRPDLRIYQVDIFKNGILHTRRYRDPKPIAKVEMPQIKLLSFRTRYFD